MDPGETRSPEQKLARLEEALWVAEAPVRTEAAEPAAPGAVKEEPREARRGKSAESLRKNLRDIADALGPRDLDMLTAFAEFLKARRAARSFSQHHHEAHATADDDAPASQEIANEPRSDAG